MAAPPWIPASTSSIASAAAATADGTSAATQPPLAVSEEAQTGDGVAQAWLAQFPLCVVEGKIVNSFGQRFRLKGVNWYGASDIEQVVGGLAQRSLTDVVRTIADLGFNVVRLPFSNEMLRETTTVKERAIDYVKNPELVGMRPIEVLDAVVDALGAEQIAVIPNNHCCFSAWGGEPDGNGLWWNQEKGYSEAGFFEDWRRIAQRYAQKPWVIGYDLRNEVRPVPGRPVRFPVWQASGVKASGFLQSLGAASYHDWRKAAGQVGELILKENPDKLIVVERIVFPAQSIEAYLSHPPSGIPRERYVVGVHCYSWMGPGLYIPKHVSLSGWNRDSFKKSMLDFARTSAFGKSLGGSSDSRCYVDMTVPEQLSCYLSQWGFALESSSCPVWISEFGQSWDAGGRSREWFEVLARYMEAWNVDYAYWALNGSPKPSGKNEPYGLLDNRWMPFPGDWRCRALGLPEQAQARSP